MDRELNMYGIRSWKWYCHADPGASGGGFQLDDDNAAWFYAESRKRGMKTFSVHKGYSYQSRILGHLANPKDVEKAALENKDLTSSSIIRRWSTALVSRSSRTRSGTTRPRAISGGTTSSWI